MTSKQPLRHMIVLLPGIMGSVLKYRQGKKDQGEDVWALSGQALLNFLKSGGKTLRKLEIIQDDPEADDLSDGIFADRLIPDIYNIPGLIQGAGYDTIRLHILKYLKGRLHEGSIHTPRNDANFYTFPYDWRRDLRAIARHLKQFIEPQLDAWRAWSGDDQAQIIFIAHSMGGLVARYYVEKMEGWQRCRALLTFGTPHRGSLKPLDFLSNGFRISGGMVSQALMHTVDLAYSELFDDLANLVRSFPSVYQLLPTYEVVQVGNAYKRPCEITKIPNISEMRAKSAREDFHEVIRLSIEDHENNEKINGYSSRTIPIVGVDQDTYQSAFFNDGRIELSYNPPDKLDPLKADGDGTVPRVSAIPIELDNADREHFLAEHHGWLTNEGSVLNALLARIRNMAAQSSESLHGSGIATEHAPIRLTLDPLYLAGEPITIRLALGRTNMASCETILHIESMDGAADPILQSVDVPQLAGNTLQVPPLPPGLYRVKLESEIGLGNGPVAVHSAFEVIE
jgi:pimeloyl-ACP methyl ester carboxylesterase